jgi:parallel beta helix pectate lyase-like protein/uncharacterized protein DUF1565
MHRTALVVTAALLSAAGCSSGGSPAPGPGSSPGPTASTSSPAPAPSPPPAPPSPPSTPPPPRYAHEWYVARTGSDAASGTDASPFKTITRAIAAAGPGDRITVRAGTYAERVVITDSTARAGTEDAPILLQGDGRPRLVPGAAEMSMVDVSRPHWILDGFEVDAQGQDKIGVSFFGSTEGSTLRASLVHGGSGPAAVSTSAGASGVVIDGVEIHHFWRDGDDSHGVAVEPGSRRITVRGSRIHDVSGDSVQCIGPEGESSLPPVDGLLVEGNDFSSNRENALDVKTCKHVVARSNVMHDFLQQSLPGGCAVVIHMSADDVLVEDNEIYRVGRAISLGGNHVGPVPQRVRIQHNRIHDVQVGTELDGVGISIQNSSGAEVVGNAFARIASTAIELGDGTGGATDSLRIADNLIDADVALKVGADAPGLSVGPNGFRPSATFVYHGLLYDYAGWKALGFGARSWLTNAMFANADTLAPAPGAVDQGSDEGLPFCGAAPDLGAVETGC